jgi:phage tail sheath protein FI
MASSSYLSPGVYVEETDTGNKPIEGVSTSTTGLVGVTERGPANVPTLVTSFGEFRRVFGGYLPIADFTDPTGRVHCYLPHAAEGFFVNRGKRAYIVRVTAEEAVRANRRLFFHDLAIASPDPTVLLRAAEEGTGTAINLPAIVVLLPTGLASPNDVIRIGDGSRAEYRTIANIDTTQRQVSLNLPLQRSHAIGVTVRDVAGTVDTTNFTTGDFTLAADANAGATQILLSAGTTAADLTALAALAAPELIGLDAVGANGEYVLATAFTAIGTTQVRLTLANPVQRHHAAGPGVLALSVPAGTNQVLQVAANGGDSIIYLNALGGAFTNPVHLAVIDPGSANQEVRRIGTLSELTLDLPPYEDYPISSVVEHVTIADDNRTITASTTADATLNDVSAIEPGMAILFTTPAAATIIVSAVDVATKKVTFLVPLAAAPTGTASVQPRKVTADVAAGAVVLPLDARIGLSAGDVIRVGVAPNDEYVTVRQVSDPRSVPPDAGAIVIDSPLRRGHANGTDVHRQAVVLDATRQSTLTLLDANTSATQLLVAEGTNYAATEFVRVTLPSGDVHYHQISANTAATPGTIELDVALIRSHAAGNTVVARQPLLEVRALDTGDWGNRVLVSVSPEEKGLLARAEVTAATPSPGPGIPSTLRLTTVTGVEAGTVLELRDPDDAAVIGDFIKVKAIDRAANNLVILDSPGLSATHIAAFTAAGAAGKRLVAHSKEFRLEVLLLGQPNFAVPIRNEDPIDLELFQLLSMDQRHSHYFERVIGSTFVDGAANDDLGRPLRRSDRRSEGGSAYIRVHDLGSSDADRERVRLWPETLVDRLPSGLLRPARHRLGEGESLAIFGDDSVATMGDPIYQGVDDREPDKRTGIYALKNVQSISLVAAPGQVTVAVQQALIDHCEEMRYRFAVLDAQGPDKDTLDDIQAQRQQFDTKYAAFYHPWLTILDPFPTNLAAVGQFPIAPSGHVLGIYARTDDERGVHKAPANEVVGGLTGLTRYLNQREQDVLNPYPVNIDVIRDFRPYNRGIRVWGARCITSDSDWKYINVRRLVIFIEDSIDRGLQWVVFEPNSEELWARVRRAITNFLTTVWRNGALEGTTREQAFYVKCDRTTMTRDDIDNGRLIAVIGVAPVKPAEFVIIRIGLWTADASS